MTNAETFTDRRRHQRFRVCKGAKIVFNSRACVIDCTVRNISEGGACLVLATPTVLPPEFELAMDGDTLRCCHVMWHFDSRLGVMF